MPFLSQNNIIEWIDRIREEGGTMTATLEAPAAPQAPEVAALSDDTRQELVALREGGMTLAELRTRFPQLTSEQIRDALPPGNARERKAKQAKVTEVTKGTGGRSGKKQSDPEPEPKAKSAGTETPRRYVEGKQVIALAESVLAARQVIGRNKLAELLSVTGSAVWRFENGRIHEDELDGLISGMSQVDQRIEQGDFVKPERQPKAKQPSKADLTHRVEVAVELLATGRKDKSITKAGLIDAALAVLDPPQPTESE
jgi:predicted XRE-type DNA-binding protein